MFFGYVTKERTCPRCKSAHVYRVKRNGIAMRAVCSVLKMRPYWCENCDNFFLAPRQERGMRIEGQYGISGRKGSGAGRPDANNLPH